MTNIICLEARWYKKNPVTVQPFLETLRLIQGIEYSHFPCNSIEELKQHLSFNPYGSNVILYIAAHGRRGKISFSDTNDKKRAPLEDIAEMMGDKFYGAMVHFSSCSILNVTPERYYDFKLRTGLSIVSGYTVETGFIESYAMDMLIFSNYASYKRKTPFVKYMYKKYPDLIKQSGLYIE